MYGGPDLSAPQLAKLCTTTSSPLQVSSTGNLLTVRFKSDAYVSGRGFNASWAEVQGGGCSAELLLRTRTINNRKSCNDTGAYTCVYIQVYMHKQLWQSILIVSSWTYVYFISN